MACGTAKQQSLRPSLGSPLSPSSYRCRICLETVSPKDEKTTCYCKGTMAYVHRNCLEEWLTVAQIGKCEICNYQFQMVKVPATFREYLRNGITQDRCLRRSLIFDSLCVLVIVPFLALCTWLTIETYSRADFSEFQWQVLSLGVLTLVLGSIFVFWMVLALRFHHRSWSLWRETHSKLKLADEANRRRSCSSNSASASASRHGLELRPDATAVSGRRGSDIRAVPPLLMATPDVSRGELSTDKEEDLCQDSFNHSFLSPQPCLLHPPRFSFRQEDRPFLREEISGPPQETRSSLLFASLSPTVVWPVWRPQVEATLEEPTSFYECVV